jgi:hypothetical protein
MADATHQLDSRKDPDPVDVESKSKYAYCLHTSQFFSFRRRRNSYPGEERPMPPLWNIGCTVEDDKALDLGCNYIADTGACSLPCKDCDPSYVHGISICQSESSEGHPHLASMS